MFEAVLAGWRAQQRSRGNKRIRSRPGCGWCAGWVITRSCGRGSGGRCRWRTSFVTWRRRRGRADVDASQLPVADAEVPGLPDGRSVSVAAVCERLFGCRPVQPLDERNLIVHVDDWEGDPARRALTVDELQAFFDFCDRQVRGRRALRRKGALRRCATARCSRSATAGGCAARSWLAWMSATFIATRGLRSSASSGSCGCATARARAAVTRRLATC